MAKHENLHKCEHCENTCNIYNSLNESEHDYFEKNRTVVKFKPGQHIIKQGTPSSHIISLVDGLAKLYIEGLNNKNLIVKLVKPVEIISSPGILVDNLNHFSIETLVDSVVCLLDIRAFSHFMKTNNKFMESTLKTINERTIFTYERMTTLLQKQMHGRIADALVYLSEDIFCDLKFDMILSRQDLADLTAMSKESTCRILKEFKEENLILTRGNYLEILDLKTLKQISKNG